MNKLLFKFIQINIYKGKYLGDLLKFLKKEQADFIAMQEVTSGPANLTFDFKGDIFEHFKKELGMSGVFHKDTDITTNPPSKDGNALLSKFPIVRSKVITLKAPMVILYDQTKDVSFFPFYPRHLLDAIVDVGGERVHAISWHGAWTAPPTDTAETLRQAKIVTDYLKSISEPFILGCDLNSVIQNKTVDLINKVANNLMFGSGVLQTTHPKAHKIVPRGYLVDYIFTSKHFQLKSIRVPEILVSDHLPVVGEVEFLL